MTPRIWLACAAIFVSASAGYAADYPARKAAEAQFVEACVDLSPGHYRIPGTDTCVRIGGYVRLHWSLGGPGGAGPNFVWSRVSSLQTNYTRALFNFDARPMTEYGRARIHAQWRATVQLTGGGVSSGLTSTTPIDRISLQSAYIQLAGWTFGYRQSVYDYLEGRYLILTPFVGSNRWITQVAYQVSPAPNWTATLSAEDSGARRYPILQVDPLGQLLTGAVTPPSAVPDLNYLTGVAGKSVMPEVVGRLQHTGSWGDVALMGALHEVRSAYAAVAGAGFPAPLPAFPGSTAGSGGFITPDTKIGYVLQGGMTLKTPGSRHPTMSDTIATEAAYARGALDYTLNCGSETDNGDCVASITGSKGPLGNFLLGQHNFGVLTGDAVFNPASGALDLTTSWTAQVRYRHFWAPTWRSVVGVGYTRVDFTGPGQISSSSAAGVFVGSDFSVLQGYSELIWSPYNDLDLGVSVSYTRVDPRGAKDVDSVSGTFRAQWSF
jgi:hypothetical protein